ncbi:MAG: hypothetical protein JRI22_13070 [Deltaproteobacteria bacterium]|nr:hypothetical protein [Deltaproteobacteria bacterium]
MKRGINILILSLALIFTAACATSYKAKPLPFRTPTAYGNAVEVAGAMVAAQAYEDSESAEEYFGFDIRGAGMLPVQVVFDNRGPHALQIRPEQTFLEDSQGNLWPILDSQTAYERATRYAKTKQVFKEGAYGGFLGAAAGAIIGAAIGIVAGENVAGALGKGAALGGAAGATLGGVKGYTSDEARRVIMDDLHRKSLENRPVRPQSMGYGFLFFPGEARSARLLRLQLQEVDTGTIHVFQLYL